MFTHCNRKFKSFEKWFLFNNKDFINRKLSLGTCPICKSCIVELFEVRKSDGKVYRKVFYKKDAEKVIQQVIKDVEYTSGDIKQFSKEPFGFSYGENIEIRNRKGEVIKIKQKKCDFYGVKKVVRNIKIKNI